MILVHSHLLIVIPEKKYTFTVDPHGKLIGKDESMKTIELILLKYLKVELMSIAMNEFLFGCCDDNNENMDWVRGFIHYI